MTAQTTPVAFDAATPIRALHSIYKIAERDMNILEGLPTKDEGDKRRLMTEDRRRWNAVKDIPDAILLQRPEDAEDVRILLSWLGVMLDRIESKAERGSPEEAEAKAALVAAENLAIVALPMLGLTPIDEYGFIAESFNLRYSINATEG